MRGLRAGGGRCVVGPHHMSCLDGFIPARGLAFIRHIEAAESYAGSTLIIPAKARDKIAKRQFVVTAVGGWEFCDDEDCERPHPQGLHLCSLDVGDWVLCRNRTWETTPDPDIFVIRQSDVLGVFEET